MQKDLLEKAVKSMAGQSINLLVAGARGSGKTTLIYNMFPELSESWPHLTKDDNFIITQYQYKMNEVTIQIFETIDIRPRMATECHDNQGRRIVAMIHKHIPIEVDVLLYCKGAHELKTTAEDYEIIRLLTNAFTEKIWKRTILVLTYADQYKEEAVLEERMLPVDEHLELFHEALTTRVTTIPNDSIIALPAGLVLANPPDWKQSLLLRILEICNQSKEQE